MASRITEGQLMTIRRIMKIPKERHVEGLIGLEIEAEGHNLPRLDTKTWKTTRDGSLQGEAYEYVLRTPVSVAGLTKALAELDLHHKKSESRVADSVRAGVHVHINVQDLTIVQLYNFMTLYLILEGLLVRWCGPTRDGNLFCLKATDAEDVVRRLIRAARTKTFRRVFHDDDLRYASMNVKAVSEHGSLEFRSMRGTRDFSLIETWALMLVKLKESSLMFEDPIDVINGFSGADKAVFIHNVMGEYAKNLLTPDYERVMFEGMRVAQDIAYSIQWESLNGSLSSNPFDPDGEKEDEHIDLAQLAVPRPPRGRPVAPSHFDMAAVWANRAQVQWVDHDRTIQQRGAEAAPRR